MIRTIGLRILRRALLTLMVAGSATDAVAQSRAFRVMMVASRHPDHAAMIAAARPFVEQLGARDGFTVDFTQDLSAVDESTLSGYQVLVQLQLAPFEVPSRLQGSVQKFVDQGKGWVGIHAAGLTGNQFQGTDTVYWKWFETFFGGVVYSPHPAFQKGTVRVEDRSHPITLGLPPEFQISDEWYEFDRSPRPNVHVLATVDERTYKQVHPMGDHPIVWSNEKYRRMVYIGVGHSPAVCEDPNYRALVANAILWAAPSSTRLR